MGYYSTVDGTITVAEVDLEGLKEDLSTNYYLQVGSEEMSLDSPYIVASVESVDAGKFYDLHWDLQNLISAFDIIHVDITRYGEEAGDIEKYRLQNGEIQTQLAKFEFPEDGWK